MRTNIIEINRLDSMGLRDTNYIVCDDPNTAEETFLKKIKECLKENQLTDVGTELAIACDDNWSTNNYGGTVFNSEKFDFWVALIPDVEKV